MYHPKHVEQFPDEINCVTLHLVGCILEYLLSDWEDYVFYDRESSFQIKETV
jgi:hypothetical protein